jgi:RsiW-degrading membrane proteinase PrsW (M82 family)
MLSAIALDVIVLSAFASLKWQSDPLIVLVSLGLMAAVFAFEWLFLRRRRNDEDRSKSHSHK